MQSRMHPRYYLSQAVFDREQERIFRKLWMFAGLKAMVPNHGDRMTRIIGGVSVVIGNVHGTWQAHYGECEVALETIGGLLFVSLADNPRPIQDQLAPYFYEFLKDGANALGGEFVITTWRCRFNWKLVYENLRDSLHVQFLHGKTFGNYVDFRFDVNEAYWHDAMQPLPDPSVQGLREELRNFSRGGAVGSIAQRRHVPWHDRVHRYGGDRDVYFDWMVYPNIHISSGNGGHSFSFEHHIPVGPGRTDLELIWVMAAKRQPFDDAYQAMLANMHGSKQIVGEDVVMLEAIQAGLHEDAPLPSLGAYEAESYRVERWYTALMESGYAS